MRALRRARSPLAALVVLTLVLAACGGDDDASPDAEASTTTSTTTGSGAGDDTAADDPAGADDELVRDPAEVAEMSDDELAAETYVAGYPLVVSTRTMQRLGGLVGVNSLFSQDTLSGPDSRVIVAPNRDTLYSISVMDLRSEPMALTMPAVTDRYFTYQLLSPWTDSFAYIGTRATEGRAGTWVITPPGWEGEVPDDVEVIESPTPQVFLLGRFLVDDEADVPNVTAVTSQIRLEPLSTLTGDVAAPAPPPLGTPAGTAQDIPTDAAFFDELATALAVNPPATPFQTELFAAAEERLGLGTDAPDAALLDAGAAAGAEQIDAEVAQRATLQDGWGVNLDVGAYGDDTALRAFVARVGWGANVPEEAVYPVARVDGDGAPLDGSGTYTITFPPDGLPPTDELGFWSLSVYGGDLFFAPHPSGRYTIGDRTPGLTPAEDGSLTLTLSHEEPASGTDGWLPVPEGPFVLMLRVYLPTGEVLDGTWTPPPVVPA